MRTKGSCRFKTYYKVQFYLEHSIAWQDIQKAYPTAEEARANFIPNKKCRIMEVSMAGRRPLIEALA